MLDRIRRCGKSRIFPRTGHNEPLCDDVRADPSFSSVLHPQKLKHYRLNRGSIISKLYTNSLMASLNSRATIFRSSERSMRHHSSPVDTVKSTAFNFTTAGNPGSRMTPVVNLASYTTSDRGTRQHPDIDVDEEYGVKPPSVSSTHLSPTHPTLLLVFISDESMLSCSSSRGY